MSNCLHRDGFFVWRLRRASKSWLVWCRCPALGKVEWRVRVTATDLSPSYTAIFCLQNLQRCKCCHVLLQPGQTYIRSILISTFNFQLSTAYNRIFSTSRLIVQQNGFPFIQNAHSIACIVHIHNCRVPDRVPQLHYRLQHNFHHWRSNANRTKPASLPTINHDIWLKGGNLYYRTLIPQPPQPECHSRFAAYFSPAEL